MWNEVLEKKIDTDNNKGIEEKELLNFISNQKNLEELWNYLNKMLFKDRWDNLYRTTQTQIENNTPSISNKVKNNKSLTPDEKSIMKLQYFLDNKSYPSSELMFNRYLGEKFNNKYYLSKDPFVKENSPTILNWQESRELTNDEKKLQIETILETGQYYIKFLQDKWIFQPQYEWDKTQQDIYFNELQTKYNNWEVLENDKVLFYVHQIFRDISVSGAWYSSKSWDAYREIDKIFTSKNSRNKNSKDKKIIDVLYQIRQIDDAKWIYYKSWDLLLSTLSNNLWSCKINRGPESWKLNNSLMQLNFFKPLENWNFNSIVENMYTWLLHSSARWEADILIAFKEYNLPFKWASEKDMINLKNKLTEKLNSIKQKESQQKSEIKQSILDSKKQEIDMLNWQKEILKKEFRNQNIDLNNPIAKQALDYFQIQSTMNTDLINGKAIEIETPDWSKKMITLDMIVQEQYSIMEKKLTSEIVQKWIIYEILQQNQNTINFIRDIKKSGNKLTTDEKTIDMLADITWAWDYRSDKTFNTSVDVSKELVIQVALMAISWGIANIAAKGTLLAIQWWAKLLKAWNYVARVARYTNMSKTSFWSSVRLMPELFAADIIAEWTVFHLANTTLNAPLQGLSAEEYFKTINPFWSYQEQQADGSVKDVSNMLWYVESVAFMWVMKSFGSITNQITKALGWKTLAEAQQLQTINAILTANAITLPGEILAMQLTSASISSLFGHDIDLSPKSRAHTLALVIGLRIAHNATSPMKKASENIEWKIQENSMQQWKIEILNIIPGKEPGSVQWVEYRVLNWEWKPIDHGIASKETIESALKNKKQSETSALENNKENKPEIIQYKVYETKFLEIHKDKQYNIETVELNWCTWAVIIIKNNQWKSFALATHFPPIEGLRDKSIAETKKYLEDNKYIIGNISSVDIFAVTDVSRKNTDYQTIVDITKEKTGMEPALHLSEYASRDKTRSDKENLGKMNIAIDKEGNIKFIHEWKDIYGWVKVTPEQNKNQLNISTETQKQNSLNSDKLVNPDNTINPESKSNIEKFLREQNVLWKDQTLSEAQIRKIYEVHNMQRKSWETDDIQLNIRKWLTLREWFTLEQIRALMEGKICWVAEKIVRQSIKIEKKDTEKLLPSEFQNYMLKIQKELLEAKINNNPDINKTDNVFFEEYITLIDPSSSYTSPQKHVIKIEIENTTVDKFLDVYKKELETQINELLKKSDWLSSEKTYSIYDFNQDIFFKSAWAKEAKNESGRINYISNGKLIYWAEEINLSKKSTPKSKPQVDPEIVEANSKLSDKDRIIKAKELIWDITPIQEKAILEAHSQPWEIYNLDFSQIRARTEILQQAWFTSEQIRNLMKNGICWSFFWDLFKKSDKPLNKDQISEVKKLGKDINLDMNLPVQLEKDIEIFYKNGIKNNIYTAIEMNRTTEKNFENKIQGEKDFYRKVLEVVNKSAKENPDKEIVVLFDVDNTLAEKSWDVDILRPSAVTLLNLLKQGGVKIGFLTARNQIYNQINDRLKQLQQFISKEYIYASTFTMDDEIDNMIIARLPESYKNSFTNESKQKIKIYYDIIDNPDNKNKTFILVDDLPHPIAFGWVDLQWREQFYR